MERDGKRKYRPKLVNGLYSAPLKTNPDFDTNAPPFEVRGCKCLRLTKIFAEKLLCFGNTYNLKHIFATMISKNNVSIPDITVPVAVHAH